MRVNVQLDRSGARLAPVGRALRQAAGRPLRHAGRDRVAARQPANAELIAAEARRAEQTPNPDSMDFYFQGQALLNRGFAPEMLAKARGFFERALEFDPGNLDALVGLAGVGVWSASAT